MVAPYRLMLLSLLLALAALQLPVLPTAHQTLGAAVAVLTGLALIVARARRVAKRHGRFSQPRWITPALVLTGTTLTVLIPVLITSYFWQARQLSPLCQRELVTVEGSIDELVQGLPGPRNVHRLHIRVGRMEPQRCAGPRRIRVYLDADSRNTREHGAAYTGASDRSNWSITDLKPGARMRFEARLRQPRGMVNPAAMNGEKSFLLADIHAVGSVRRIHALDVDAGGSINPGARIDRVREGISLSLRSQVPGNTGALLAALAVGDRRFMTPEIWSRLRLFGLTHLMVISGLHISMMAVPGWYFGTVLGRVGVTLTGPRSAMQMLPPFCAMLFAGGYALLSGLALPAQRALLMLSLLMIPRLLGRSVKAVGMLPMAAIALLLANPVSLLSASFWLTLGAVGLLLWFSSWLSDHGWLRSLWSAQGYMLIAMLPPGLFWFQEAGSIGAVVNLLAVPLVTFFVVPLLLCSIILEAFWHCLATSLLDGAAFCLTALWSSLSYWEPMLSRWSVLRLSPGIVAVLVALGGVILMALPRFPGRLRIAVLLLASLSIPASRGDNSAVEVLFFDVGQGTAVLLRDNGRALLYDTGGGPVAGPSVAERTVMPALQGMGIGKLDTLVISHTDRDHDAGEAAVIRRTPPQFLRRAVPSADTGEACRLGVTRRFAPAVMVRYLSQHLAGDSDNNGSCVLLIAVYGRNFLLPGDIDSSREREILRYWGQDLTTDVLLAAHHGSASSNSRLWLRALSPEMLIVTAGHGNRFGHPAPRVRDTAAASGVSLRNTAVHGAISFRIYPDGRMECRSLRHRWAPFWRRGDFHRDCRRP